MRKKIILLIGPPGSGKGTQGKLLAEKLMLPHISTGDIFRKIAINNTDESRILNEYMDSGKLVPSELVNRIVKQVLLSDDYKNGCVLDGYPRNLEQAEYLGKSVEAEISCVFFNVADEVAIKRIAGRYSCEICGNIYNKYYDNPKIEGVCDNCGSTELIFRSDDDEKTVLSRMEEYKKETLPLIEYYKNKGKFFNVNAAAKKEEVKAEIDLIVKTI
jgi:adenylate kinase